MAHYDIFISYKRNDKEKVFAIKDYIEKNVGVRCWIDLNGIESDAQFVNVIMNAIDNSTVFLFMYSHSHSIIEDYETDWTVREINYAQSLKKRIVFINIDGSPFTKYFIFMFPQKQQVDATSENDKIKLCKDLKKWLKIEKSETRSDVVGDIHYKVVNDTKSQPIIIKDNNHAQEEKEIIIDSQNMPRQSMLDDIRQRSRNMITNKTRIIIVKFAQTLRRGWLWIVGFVGLLVLSMLLYVWNQNVNNEVPNSKQLADSLDVIPSVKIQSIEGNEVLSQAQIPDDFVLVPGGIYRASEWDSKAEKDRYFDLKIDSFYVCKYELTQKEFENVMGRLDPQNYTFPADNYKEGRTNIVKGDSIPVIGSYLDFINYCMKKNSQEGYDGFYDINGENVSVKSSGNGYRLLTKHEWAYIASKGNYYKNSSLGDVAWYGRNSNNRPHTIGQKKPNDLGVYDLFGNVSEFVLDDNSMRGYRSFGGGDYLSWLYYTDVQWTSQRIGTRIVFVPKG